MFDVSIVIVCMNNIENLIPCLESIRRYTTKVSYETIVVAYLFSKENLKKVKRDYPWVTFIESNEIRGFSENNNLALRQATGKYCFVLNDDTEMKMPVIDSLFMTIENLPENVAVVSPKSVFADGSFQSCGRPVFNTIKYALSCLWLYNNKKSMSYYEKYSGVFEVGDIIGAFFLIKTNVFQKIGWFDERFFFCPEDIAVSYELRKRGYKCYVNSDVVITHYEGMSGGSSLSMIKTATAPAGVRGNLIFHSHGNKLLYVLLATLSFFQLFLQFIVHLSRGLLLKRPNSNQILACANLHSFYACFTKKTPKELFIERYNVIHK